MWAVILETQRVNLSKTNTGEERKTTPRGSAEPSHRRKILLASRRQEARPWARPAGGRLSLGKAGAVRGLTRCARQQPASRRDRLSHLRPVRSPQFANPTLRSAADMCAAPMPSLAHIFRGTFIHSTWTSPMEVLRDHLLGVSDSGKVSGRGVWRTPTGARTGGRNLSRCAAEPAFAARGAEPQLRSWTWLFDSWGKPGEPWH